MSTAIDLDAVARQNPSRARLHTFIAEAAASIPAGARVLDAGAGDGRHRPLFSGAQYEAADFEAVPTKTYSENDMICDLSAIPVEDDRYDLVLLTQVLEHVPEPHTVLNELARVLKPGGHLWATMPLFYEEHDQPYDFFRYTQFGVKHLCESAGLEVERLEWLEGYFGTLSYQAKVATKLPVDPAVYGGGLEGRAIAVGARVTRSLAWRLVGVFGRLEGRHKLTGVGLPKNFALVAVKAAGG